MNVLIFGATGSAGGSVLQASLAAPVVREVRTITRRPLRIAHAKLRSTIHDDYRRYDQVEEAFAGIDACFFCLGISVNQVSGEDEYRTITHDFAIAAAEMLRRQSPDAFFHYLSGHGAGEKSRQMWARVKGETEREMIDRFNGTCWRPGFIDGALSDNAPWIYQAARPIFRLLFRPFRRLYIAGEDLGKGMIQGTVENIRGRILENPEIRELADRAGWQ